MNDLAFETGRTVSGTAVCAVLGHPVRWAAVQVLAGAEGVPVPVSELASRVGVERATLSSHLPQMLAAGVVALQPDPGGDGRKRCLALPVTAQVRRSAVALEVDFGAVSVRFPM